MKTYEDEKAKILSFMKKEKIDAYTLQRIAKNLCRCGHCKMFVQHYTSQGQELDFGHCIQYNIPKSKNPYDTACGSWVEKEE